MKNKKVIFTIGGLALIIIIVLTIIFVQKNTTKTQEYKPLYLTADDVTDIKGCYDLSTDYLYCSMEKKYIQKVLVDLNGTDKSVFTVLKGNIKQDEDLLLIYDGLYKASDKERYYSYDRGLEILDSLNWKNAKTIRLLTKDEAILLGCSNDDNACSWLVEDSGENQSSENNSSDYYGGFTIYHEPDSEDDDSVDSVNIQGLLYSNKFANDDNKYGLKPVIQINSKYVKPYSTISKVHMKKDNQLVNAKFINDKLVHLKITNTYSNLTKDAFNQLNLELNKKVNTDNIKYTISTSYKGDDNGFEGEIFEDISIDCKNITSSEIKDLIALSSLNITSTQFISEMKVKNYVEN